MTKVTKNIKATMIITGSSTKQNNGKELRSNNSFLLKIIVRATDDKTTDSLPRGS